MKTTKKYSVLIGFETIEERYDYLKLGGSVGISTFGWDRYYNQRFYKSLEWKRVRDKVIVRDNGCDLGVPGFEIGDKILIHHESGHGPAPRSISIGKNSCADPGDPCSG